MLVSRFLAKDAMSEAELSAVEELAAVYRERLHDLSWFMRILNEHVARMANAEEGVKGRFWEGRFKSQALLDEQALLAAMAYVDLNPVRAGIAETPEASEFTSIQDRISSIPRNPEQIPRITQQDGTPDRSQPSHAALMPFDATARANWAIPFGFEDYLELVDWSGRALHPHKRGFIAEHRPKILDRLGFDGDMFIEYGGRLLKEFGSAIGSPESIAHYCARRQSKYLRGVRLARKMFAVARAA